MGEDQLLEKYVFILEMYTVEGGGITCVYLIHIFIECSLPNDQCISFDSY